MGLLPFTDRANQKARQRWKALWCHHLLLKSWGWLFFLSSFNCALISLKAKYESSIPKHQHVFFSHILNSGAFTSGVIIYRPSLCNLLTLQTAASRGASLFSIILTPPLDLPHFRPYLSESERASALPLMCSQLFPPWINGTYRCFWRRRRKISSDTEGGKVIGGGAYIVTGCFHFKRHVKRAWHWCL